MRVVIKNTENSRYLDDIIVVHVVDKEYSERKKKEAQLLETFESIRSEYNSELQELKSKYSAKFADVLDQLVEIRSSC